MTIKLSRLIDKINGTPDFDSRDLFW